jgi:hypothetical protein
MAAPAGTQARMHGTLQDMTVYAADSQRLDKQILLSFKGVVQPPWLPLLHAATLYITQYPCVR